MTRADYQLRHGMFGKIGTVWSRQANAATRNMAQAITEEAGNAPLLQATDVIANYASVGGRIMVDNLSFRFVDGDFLLVGRNPKDFTHLMSSDVSLALRDAAPDLLAAPTPTPVATFDTDLIRESTWVAALPPGEDWYLLPMPTGVTPIIIEGLHGDMLVAGIDFSAHDGFIATRLHPAQTFPSGLVRIVTAHLDVPQPHSFVLSAPTDRLCSKFLTIYAKQSQSMVAFKRAAAEFCGMFVFPEADVILRRFSVVGAEVYVTAALGELRIDYPHDFIQIGTTVAAGDAISPRFEILSTNGMSAVVSRALDAGAVVSLDGILPTEGLTLPSRSLVLLADGDSDPISGKPHVRMQLDGLPENLTKLWKRQRAHELATGAFLFDQFFESGEKIKLVNFSDVLTDYYGAQLAVIMFGGMRADMEARLRQFVSEHKPVGCVLLTARIPD